jgi:hypothetical protein
MKLVDEIIELAVRQETTFGSFTKVHGSQKTNVKKLLKAIATVVMLATPSQAFYTGCTVEEDTIMMTRPGGNVTMPRWHTLKKGEKVALLEWYPKPDMKRKTPSGIILAPWLFVHHWVDQDEEYGWVPRKALNTCQMEDGTP